MNADRQTSNEDGVNAEGFVAGGAFWGGCKVSESDVAHVWTPLDFPPNWGRARKFKCSDRSWLVIRVAWLKVSEPSDSDI